MPRPHDLGIPGRIHQWNPSCALEDYCHHYTTMTDYYCILVMLHYYCYCTRPTCLFPIPYYPIVLYYYSYLILRLDSLWRNCANPPPKSSSFVPSLSAFFRLQSPPNASSMLPQCGQLPDPSTLLLHLLTGPSSIRSPGHQISPIRCSLCLARPLDWSNTRSLLGLPPLLYQNNLVPRSGTRSSPVANHIWGFSQVPLASTQPRYHFSILI